MTGAEIQLFSYAIYEDPSILDEVNTKFLTEGALQIYNEIVNKNISEVINKVPKVNLNLTKEDILKEFQLDYIRRELINISNYIRSDLKDPEDTLEKIKIALDKISEDINAVKNERYDLMSHLTEFLENNRRDYIPFTISKIDEKLFGLLRGNIFTIGGDTGSMKTTFALWLSSRWALRGYKVLFFEKEMPVDDIVRRLININCGIKNQDLLLGLYNRETLEEKIRMIGDNLYVVPATDFNNVIDVYKIVERYKPDIFVIDFITQLDFGGETASDFNFNMMRSLNLIKLLTHRTNSLGVIISQLKKNSIETRNSKIPRLDDLEWSAALKQLSAYVLMVFYPSLYYSNVDDSLFYLVFRKLRYGQLFYYPISVDRELGFFSEIKDKETLDRAIGLFRNF